MFACVTRARCGSHLPSRTRAWAFPPSETLAKKKIKNRYADVLPILWKTTMWMTNSILSKMRPVQDHEFHRHWFSMLDVGEFVDWEDLKGRPFDHLFVLGHGSF